MNIRMKTHLAVVALVIPLAALAATALLAAQTAPQSAPPPAFGGRGAGLEAIRAANDLVLKRQAATLKRLEELTIEARQLRIFSKRT